MIGPDRAIRRERSAPAWMAAVCLAAGAAAQSHDPNRTATIYVHGIQPGGSLDEGVYGADSVEPEIERLAELLGLPTTNDPGAPLAPNVIAATAFYGDTPPDYYTPQDVADVAAVTALYGGGMPRYATIVAKYARHLMERSGARQVNIVSASLGSLVARWLIEKDVEGLASAGRIARWMSLEGVVAGNWAVSRDELAEVWELLEAATVDLAQMRYDWIEANLHAPAGEADNPLLSGILLGQTGSTDDSGIGALLTGAMLLWGEFQPNDGLQGTLDSFYHSVSPRARFLGRPPARGLHHVTHFELRDHAPAFVQAAAFLTQRRRVTVTVTRARVADLHEPDHLFWDWRPAEVVIGSRVRSPEARRRWGVSEPIASRHRDGATSPIVLYGQAGEDQELEQVIFDEFVFEGEAALELELWAEEIDWDLRYGVLEPLGQSGDALGSVTIDVPVTRSGACTFAAAHWNGAVEVEVYDYPFARLGGRGDLDGDGRVNGADLIALISAWGDCPGPPGSCPADLDGDGAVGTGDLLVLLAHWAA